MRKINDRASSEAERITLYMGFITERYKRPTNSLHTSIEAHLYYIDFPVVCGFSEN
ncbi:MAG: hypothetical protein MjAS7_2282 [Metallosphaera javensis (ex Sakai et al. 2022)]|nr:MAG: hypothetical protein MjAS7_2282 [Metallosphaera javensis (ex Sakai et al. 2022)]